MAFVTYILIFVMVRSSCATVPPNHQPIMLPSLEPSYIDSVTAKWILCDDPEEVVTSYVIQNVNDNTLIEKEISEENVIDESVMFVTLTGLLPNRIYFIRVRAKNFLGYGPWSDMSKIRTARRQGVGLVGPIVNISSKAVKNSESSSVNLTWSSPIELKNNAASKLSYCIHVCQHGISCSFMKFVLGGKTHIVLDNLKAAKSYRFKIHIYNENNESDPGLTTHGTFKTKSKDTATERPITTQNPSDILFKGSKCVPGLKPKPRCRIDGETAELKRVRNAMECRHNCGRRRDCAGANYSKKGQICRLQKTIVDIHCIYPEVVMYYKCRYPSKKK